MFSRTYVLGSPTGRYVQQLLATAPAGWVVHVCEYESLSSGLAMPAQAGMRDSHSHHAPPGTIGSKDAILVRSMGNGTLEQIVFRMDCLAYWQAQGTTILNPPKALEWAIDKYASLSMLDRAGLPIPATFVCQDFDSAIAAFEQLGGDVVVKPIFGSEGRGLIRVADIDHAARVFRSLVQMQQVIYQQKFLGTQVRDLRLLLVGEQCWAMERASIDWRKNLARGGTALPCQPSDLQRQIAQSALETLGLTIGGVDLMVDQAGRTFVLEVNGIPGWQGMETLYDVNIAGEIWKWLQQLGRHR